MNQNWFPGHMKKGLLELEQKIKLVDIVIEVADARLPISSRNHLFDKLIKEKRHILVLSKSDLADEKRLEQHIKTLDENIKVIKMSKRDNSDKLLLAIDELMAEKQANYQKKGITYWPRALIIGIPNVGKSTLINKIMKSGGVKVENRPGVTRGFTFIRLKNIELLDSPGIMMPKFDNALVSYRLLTIGTIKDHIIDVSAVGDYLVDYLSKEYPQLMAKRYQIEENSSLSIIEQIAQKRGLLGKNNHYLLDKAYQLLIYEVRNGLVGRISLE